MHDITSVNNVLTGPSALVERGSTSPQERRTPPRDGQPGSDRLELSAAASSYDPQAEALRAEEQRIADLRSRIAAGSYLTPDKIDVVVQRLYEEVFGN